jgi:hypothetical protein
MILIYIKNDMVMWEYSSILFCFGPIIYYNDTTNKKKKQEKILQWDCTHTLDILFNKLHAIRKF